MMIKITKTGCLLPLLISCFVQAAEPNDASVAYLPYLEMGGTRYFQDSFNWSYEGSVWLPILQQSDRLLYSTLTFVEPVGKWVNASVTIGYRWCQPEDERLLGIYTGFDMERDNLVGGQKQFNFGFEWWQNKLFLGCNYYLPFKKEKCCKLNKVGNTVTECYAGNMKGGL